jgi:hypothetical protein
MATTTSSTSSSNLPSYVEEPVKKSLTNIDEWLNSDENYIYGSKPGESLYTGLTDQQQKSVGNIDWLADQDLDQMFNLNESTDLWRQFANTGPAMIEGDFSGATVDQSGMSPVTTERVVDEGGFLGSRNDYMDPYLQEVLGNQIRRMNEQTERDRRALGASATMSGAFGDARHGMMEGRMVDDANRAVLDATGMAHSAAFSDAMNRRAGDIGRKDQMGVFNAGQDLQTALANLNSQNAGLDRGLTMQTLNQGAQQKRIDNLGTAAEALKGIGADRYDLFNNVNDSLFNAGNVIQQDKELQRQSQEDFQTAIMEKRYDDAMRLLGAATGAPYSKSETSTSTEASKSNSGFFGLAGSLLGSLFG